jgi:hypothetical protein
VAIYLSLTMLLKPRTVRNSRWTNCARAACAALVLAFWHTTAARAEPASKLEALIGQIVKQVGPNGTVDLSGFDCAQIHLVEMSVQECQDPVSSLRFMQQSGERGDIISMNVIKGVQGPTKFGVAVPDRASFDRLRDDFLALEQSELFAGLQRCAVQMIADPALIMAFRIEPENLSIFLAFPALDDEATEELDTAGNDGAILTSIVLAIATDAECPLLG